jgi:hypothetical protein
MVNRERDPRATSVKLAVVQIQGVMVSNPESGNEQSATEFRAVEELDNLL